MAMSRKPVELHIDELILRGVAPSQRDALRTAIQQELTRLMDSSSQESVTPSKGSREGISKLASQVAQNIHQQVGSQ